MVISHLNSTDMSLSCVGCYLKLPFIFFLPQWHQQPKLKERHIFLSTSPGSKCVPLNNGLVLFYVKFEAKKDKLYKQKLLLQRMMR